MRDRTQTGMFWICFEFYALLFEFVSYFVLRISYFLFPAMPAYEKHIIAMGGIFGCGFAVPMESAIYHTTYSYLYFS